MPPKAKMLEGYTILDLSQYLSGPLCASTLATFGAEVIKVEPPAGDGNRQLPPFIENGDAEEPRHNRSLVFYKRNQGKKSIVLDLKTDGGKQILKTLMGNADVLLHNFREGVAERVGADFETASAANPNIIYCAVTGQYGGIGDVPDTVTHPPGGVIDLIGQALSGLLGATGPNGGQPVRSRTPIADQAAGLYATVAVLAAIIERDVRPQAQKPRRIRVPMVETLASLLWDESLDVSQAQGFEKRTGNLSGRLCPYNTYETRDDKFVTIAAASSGEWRRLNEAIEVDELNRSEWTDASQRTIDREQIDAIISGWTKSLDRDTVITQLRSYGVTVGAVIEVDDMLASDAYRSAVLYEIPDRSFGTLYAPRFPIEIDGNRIQGPTGPVPGLGEHSREVLEESAGLSAAEIDTYIAAGAVYEPEHSNLLDSLSASAGSTEQNKV